MFRARISAGTVDAIIARAGDALEDPYEDLFGRVRRSKSVNMDETGWRLQGQKRTLWGAFTSKHAVLQSRRIGTRTTPVACWGPAKRS